MYDSVHDNDSDSRKTKWSWFLKVIELKNFHFASTWLHCFLSCAFDWLLAFSTSIGEFINALFHKSIRAISFFLTHTPGGNNRLKLPTIPVIRVHTSRAAFFPLITAWRCKQKKKHYVHEICPAASFAIYTTTDHTHTTATTAQKQILDCVIGTHANQNWMLDAGQSDCMVSWLHSGQSWDIGYMNIQYVCTNINRLFAQIGQ